MLKILFVLPSMRAGGTATSLLNLMQLMQEDGVEADLFLLEHDGVFLERAKKMGRLLPENTEIAATICKKQRIKTYGLRGLLVRGRYAIKHRFLGVDRAIEPVLKHSAKALSDKYDVVIAYQEQLTTRYVRYIQAQKRIAWLHVDYNRFKDSKSKEFWKYIYEAFDEIACVSKIVKDSVESNLNIDASKTHLIYNTIPNRSIRCRSKMLSSVQIKNSAFKFISMGRMVKEKGFDRVIFTAAALKRENIDFAWYILGEGEEKSRLQKMISEYHLEDRVFLPGVFENPFPIVNQCYCFVMSSVNEAQPMVLNEALTLHIPVITTDFPSAREVVKDEVFGLITENSEKGLLNAVKRFIRDPFLREKIKRGAMEFEYNNQIILTQVYDIIGFGRDK